MYYCDYKTAPELINLPFSLSEEIALYSSLVCVSQSPSPIKFLQAAYGKAPDEQVVLSKLWDSQGQMQLL